MAAVRLRLVAVALIVACGACSSSGSSKFDASHTLRVVNNTTTAVTARECLYPPAAPASTASACTYREATRIAPAQSTDFSRPDIPRNIAGVLEVREPGRTVCMPLPPPDQPAGMVVADVSSLTREPCPSVGIPKSIKRTLPKH